MKIKTVWFVTVWIVLVQALCPPQSANAENKTDPDQAETFRKSLVYIQASVYSYSSHQPWRHTDLSQRIGYGCAVGPYEVLTTACNMADASFVTVQKFGQNEQIPAQVTVIDYESNLSLLKLDSSAVDEPLQPVSFSEDYRKGASADFYWLDDDGRVSSGRGYIDRAELYQSGFSFALFLNYVISNVSQRSGLAHLFCKDGAAIGLGCWYNEDIKESGVIPAMVINQFLADVRQDDYEGFPLVGFATAPLLDPAMRAFLKMPQDLKDGAYVSDVWTLGTGSDMLKKNDVILAIDGHEIDAYGKFEDPRFKRISFEHLITTKTVAQVLAFDIWRDGDKQQLKITARNFKADDMLVPYYEYDRQGQYAVVGGFVLQKLTRKYLTGWGSNWQGKTDPHLYNYFRETAFKPSDERHDIVILNLVLPAEINLGYQALRQLVVTKYNGMPIRSIKDIIAAQKLDPQGKFDVIEFENNNPIVVIPRDQLPQADALIAQRYNIEQLAHLE